MAETGALAARRGLFAGPFERTERSRLFREDRFLTRARALFYARLAFLVLGLGVIGVPSWSAAFGIRGSKPFAVFLLMVAYSGANYLFLARKKLGKALNFATLCADVCGLISLVRGIGGVPSSVEIPSEYLLNLIAGSELRARTSANTEASAVILPTTRNELSDHHDAASESMDELRRSQRMMKEDFDLVGTVSHYCRL